MSSEPQPSVVTLRNGTEAGGVLVQSTMLALRRLIADQPVAFCEFVSACRDSGHAMFGASAATVQALGLIESAAPDGRVQIHGAVRDIVVSAVTGDDFDMRLGSPIAGTEAAR